MQGRTQMPASGRCWIRVELGHWRLKAWGSGPRDPIASQKRAAEEIAWHWTCGRRGTVCHTRQDALVVRELRRLWKNHPRCHALDRRPHDTRGHVAPEARQRRWDVLALQEALQALAHSGHAEHRSDVPVRLGWHVHRSGLGGSEPLLR